MQIIDVCANVYEWLATQSQSFTENCINAPTGLPFIIQARITHSQFSFFVFFHFFQHFLFRESFLGGSFNSTALELDGHRVNGLAYKWLWSRRGWCVWAADEPDLLITFQLHWQTDQKSSPHSHHHHHSRSVCQIANVSRNGKQAGFWCSQKIRGFAELFVQDSLQWTEKLFMAIAISWQTSAVPRGKSPRETRRGNLNRAGYYIASKLVRSS